MMKKKVMKKEKETVTGLGRMKEKEMVTDLVKVMGMVLEKNWLKAKGMVKEMVMSCMTETEMMMVLEKN